MKLDFSYASYSNFLKKIQDSGYIFSKFQTNLNSTNSPILLLRHDIDFSLSKAIPMAEVESKLGVQSTYFIMLRSFHYSPLDPNSQKAVEQLLQMGHHIGLHFDPECYSETTTTETSRQVAQEMEWLKNIFQVSPEVVSFHRPNPKILAGDPALTAPYPHTYMPYFTQSFKYFADSQGQWRFGHPLESEAFQKRNSLHILVHPIWWTQEGRGPQEVLVQHLREHTQHYISSMQFNCKTFGPVEYTIHETTTK